MRFRKKVPAEVREVLKEQLRKYKKNMTMTKEELHELESWVAAGNSPFNNGDFIYEENGWPMDFVSAMRFVRDMMDELNESSVEERACVMDEKNILLEDNDTASDQNIAKSDWFAQWIDPEAELPFL